MLEPLEDERRIHVPVQPPWSPWLRMAAVVLGLLAPLAFDGLSTMDAVIGAALWVPYLWCLAWSWPLLLPGQIKVLQRRKDHIAINDRPADDWEAQLSRLAMFHIDELKTMMAEPLVEAGDRPEDVTLSGSIGAQVLTVPRTQSIDFVRRLAGIWVVLSSLLLTAPVVDGTRSGLLIAPGGSFLIAAGLLVVLMATAVVKLVSPHIQRDHQLVLRPGSLHVDGEEVALASTRFIVIEVQGDAELHAIREQGVTPILRTTMDAAAWLMRELNAASRGLRTRGAGAAEVPEELLKLRATERSET